MWPFNRAKKFIQGLGKSRPFTKDMVRFERGPMTLVFLMDDTMVGHQNNDKIKEFSWKVAEAFTETKMDYRVGKYSGRAVPFLANEALDSSLRVKGELHAVASHMMPVLDTHYKNGVEFQRIRSNVFVTDKENRPISIGGEEFLKDLPPGMIWTRPELNLRQYTPIAEASMYVAMRVHWDDEDFGLLPRPRPSFPQEELVWLDKYYAYPNERNRCLNQK